MTPLNTMDDHNSDLPQQPNPTPLPEDEEFIVPVSGGEPFDPPPSESTAASPDLAALKAQAAKADEFWNQLLRTTADMENFKKRVARERIEAAKYASAPLLQALLPILDNMDMALSAIETDAQGDAKADSLRQGVSMVFQQLKSALADAGLESIDAAGQPFDPQWHEAISQIPTADAPEGRVLQQTRKGYRFKDRLLRPASVVVAAAPVSDPDSNAS